MKQIISVLLISVMVLALAAGCSGNRQDSGFHEAEISAVDMKSAYSDARKAIADLSGARTIGDGTIIKVVKAGSTFYLKYEGSGIVTNPIKSLDGTSYDVLPQLFSQSDIKPGSKELTNADYDFIPANVTVYLVEP